MRFTIPPHDGVNPWPRPPEYPVQEGVMTTQEYCPLGHFLVFDENGMSFRVSVSELWLDRPWWPWRPYPRQPSGVVRYLLADGRSLRPVAPGRFVIKDTGEPLWRDKAHAGAQTTA